MRRSLVLAVLLSSTGFLAAQPTTSTLFVQPPESHSCPVKLSAERTPNSGLIMVDGKHVSQGQGVRIQFAAPPLNIVSASITVHGMSGAAMVPLSSASASRNDSTENFEFNGTNNKPLLHAAVWTKSMGAISWLEITKLVYANGTAWEPRAGSRCIATPSLYVLIDAAHMP